jgi:YHS domain-containing protein
LNNILLGTEFAGITHSERRREMSKILVVCVVAAAVGLAVFQTGCSNAGDTEKPHEHSEATEGVSGTSQSKRAGEEAKPQEICPVMGRKISTEIYVDYQGKRIYFCCPSCVDTFKSDPEKYMELLKSQGVELEPAPRSGG